MQRTTVQNKAIDEIISTADDEASKLIVSCLLVGRYIAAADGIITEEEVEVVVDQVEEALHFHEPGLIRHVLQNSVDQASAPEEEIDRLVNVTEDIDPRALTHVFAFACQVAGADPSAFEYAKPRLMELATILGVRSGERDILMAVYCGQNSMLATDRRRFDDVMAKMHPDQISHLGGVGREMAEDHIRTVQEAKRLQFEGSDQDQGGASANNRTGARSASGGQSDSALAASLKDSPARRKIQDVVQQLEEFPREIYDERHRENVERLKELSSDESFRISVVGSFSSGKSTLLNAMCQETEVDLFPTSTIPCTGAVTILRHGEELKYHKRLEGESREIEIDEDEFRRLVELPNDMERAEHFNSTELDALIVEYPLSVAESGVEIIDSPGLNENPKRVAITEQYLKQSDAVVYVMTVQQLASMQDRERIDELVEQIGEEHLFFVINCFDQVAGTGEEEKVVQRAESFFRKIFGERSDEMLDKRVHYLSALEVVKHHRDEPHDEQFVEDFEGFEEAVGQYLALAKGNELWRVRADEMMQVLADLSGHAQSLAAAISDFSAIEQKLEQKRDDLAEIKRRKKRIQDNKQSAKYTIKKTKETLAESLLKEFKRFWPQLPARLETAAEEWESDGNPLWGKKDIQQDFSEAFQRDLSLAIETWQEEKVQPVITMQFKQMIGRLNQDFEEIQSELSHMRALTDDSYMPPEEEDEDQGAFMTFAKAAGGFAAGGPMGILVGATMDWEDVALNAAANVTAGVTLGALGLASGGLLIPVVALIGGVQAAFHAAGAKDKIRAQVLEAGSERLEEIKHRMIDNLGEQLTQTFAEFEFQVEELVDSQVEEIETLHREQISELEKVKKERSRQEARVQERRTQAKRLMDMGHELEAFSTITMEKAVKRTGHSPDQGWDEPGDKSGEYIFEEESSKGQWGKWLIAAVVVIALAALGMVML